VINPNFKSTKSKVNPNPPNPKFVGILILTRAIPNLFSQQALYTAVPPAPLHSRLLLLYRQ